ncbi:hypothetical protein B0H11DRAFT_499893 [Mycena galericulata]|nr:hypothetical protein B0H11DRAFT_499893 [Mycena galericulata]
MGRPVGDVIQNLRSRQRNPQESIQLLLELIRAIEDCPLHLFEPGPTIGALLPFFKSAGTQYADSVADKSPPNVDTKLAGLAVTALASIFRRFSSTSLRSDILQHLGACWPTTFIGLLFYTRGLLRTGPPAPLLEVDSPAHTFTTVVTLLQMYAEVDSLAALVRDTPKIPGLIIVLWALEVRHERLSTQLREMFPDSCTPTAAGLLNFYVLTRRDPDSYGSMFLSAVEGNAGIAGLASLNHLHRSTLAVYQYEKFPAETMRTNLANLVCLHSTQLHLHLLSHNSVSVVTEALIAITSRPFDLATAEPTTDCIQQICEYLHKYITSDGLVSLTLSLQLGLLIGLLKAHPWLGVKTAAFDAFRALLATHLPRYLIYISVLREVQKSIHVIQQVGLKDALPEECKTAWLEFERFARARLGLANAAELHTAPCNRSECTQPASTRCSSCWATAYCSKECQVAAWATHSAPCAVRRTNRQSESRRLIPSRL